MISSPLGVSRHRNAADSRITNASTGILEPLLEAEGCDVDLQNRLEGDTPLHIAVRNRWEEQDGLQLFLGMLALISTS